MVSVILRKKIRKNHKSSYVDPNNQKQLDLYTYYVNKVAIFKN